MAKWPNVPAVYGWLTLTRRGRWLIKGDPITQAAIAAFIARNYGHDEQGRWFFQNGPQRVFATLDYTPLVYRAFIGADRSLALESHVGNRPTALTGAWFDENATLIVETECGVGLIHDRDLEYIMPAFADTRGNRLSDDALDQSLESMRPGQESRLCIDYHDARVPVELVHSREVPSRFGFDPCPVPPEGGPECP
jgi:Protein of unknown function (DUF2946)